MIVGRTIMHDGAGTTAYHTPPFDRGGEAAVFSVDVTHLAGTPTLVIEIQTKNYADVSWAVNATFANITAVGNAEKEGTGLKEQVRLAFTYTAGAAGDFTHVVMASPAWRVYD